MSRLDKVREKTPLFVFKGDVQVNPLVVVGSSPASTTYPEATGWGVVVWCWSHYTTHRKCLFFLVFRLEGQEEQSARKSAASEKKRNYVKKPLNAFMLFMKEMRPKVIAECTLRESSAINQILGRKVSPFLTAVQLWASDTSVAANLEKAPLQYPPSPIKKKKTFWIFCLPVWYQH